MCFDKRVIAGLLVAVGAVFVLAPGAFAAALPLLVVAACPLSMVVMMRAMARSSSSDREATAGTGSDDSGPRSVRNEDEVERLRAELARLRAAQAAGSGQQATADDMPRAER
jgi:UPF0716 family protein affecting phage T7 exclusion